MNERFWVIGGEYRSTRFDELKPGTEKVHGPFKSLYDARKVWRDLSLKGSACAMTRFAITAEGRAQA
jgi:hypothetical protein